MVFLAAFLWGCSPGQADEQTAEEQQQAVAGLEGRDVQRVTQTASPEPDIIMGTVTFTKDFVSVHPRLMAASSTLGLI